MSVERKREICVCGAPIVYVDLRGFTGWLHAEPLSRLRVSETEAEDVHADPPHKDMPLHRDTLLHQPKPVEV
jgi:hypothetical protein